MTDDHGVDQFDRFFRSGTMAISHFVLFSEGLLQSCHRDCIDHAVRCRHRELKDLALVMHVSAAAKTHLPFAEAVHCELVACLILEILPGGIELRRIAVSENSPHRTRIVVFHIGVE